MNKILSNNPEISEADGPHTILWEQWSIYRTPNIESFTSPLVICLLILLPLSGMLFPFISDNENLGNFWEAS